MQTQTSESELLQYWQKLSSAQQDLVVNLIKNIVGKEVVDQVPINIPKEVMDGIWKDREDYLNGIGETYSREEARKYILSNRTKK